MWWWPSWRPPRGSEPPLAAVFGFEPALRTGVFFFSRGRAVVRVLWAPRAVGVGVRLGRGGSPLHLPEGERGCLGAWNFGFGSFLFSGVTACFPGCAGVFLVGVVGSAAPLLFRIPLRDVAPASSPTTPYGLCSSA